MARRRCLRIAPSRAYISFMSHAFILSLLFLAAAPALAQEAAEATRPALASETATSSEAEPPAEPADAAADPVEGWMADQTVILEAGDLEIEVFEYLARPLVVFADSPRQPQFVEQMRLIVDSIEDLAGRDVAVIVDTDPRARSSLRRELRPRGFGLVLVDKDGRVALRRPAPLSVREIARAIDRTPIRQEELRESREAVAPSD